MAREMTDEQVECLHEVAKEIQKARAKFEPFHSAHEGYAVLLEEVDEVWAMVKDNTAYSKPAAFWRECIQVAAMAICLATELDNKPF